jgi:catechol 2,3-dioxygenase-like lactoylglutathione lyase family enzyme
MKRVSHVAVFVSDIGRSQKFYESILGLQAVEQMSIVSPLHGGKINGLFLSCGDQHHDLLLIEQFDADENLMPPQELGLHHLAFELDEATTLDSFVATLAEHGVEPSYGPIRHYDGPGGDGGAGGNLAVYFADPDGHMIEVCRDMDPFTSAAHAVAATAQQEAR